MTSAEYLFIWKTKLEKFLKIAFPNGGCIVYQDGSSVHFATQMKEYFDSAFFGEHSTFSGALTI